MTFTGGSVGLSVGEDVGKLEGEKEGSPVGSWVGSEVNISASDALMGASVVAVSSVEGGMV